MGNNACHGAHGIHLPGLPELTFQALLCTDVMDDGKEHGGAIKADRTAEHLHLADLAAGQPVLETKVIFLLLFSPD